MFGKTPILHAMNHGFCGLSKPEPNPKTGSPERSFARTQLAPSSAKEGHCQQHGGHTPATSLGSNVSQHDQQRPLLPTMVQTNKADPIAQPGGSSTNALSSRASVVNSGCEIWQGRQRT